MKTIIAAVALIFATSVMAQTEVGRIYNQGGGAIVLTAKECTRNTQLWQVYAYSNNATMFGCYKLINKDIFVEWNDGEVRVYALSTVEFSEQFKRMVVQNYGNKGN